MFNRKLTTTLALLAAMAGISIFAASANAVTVDNDGLILDGPEVDLVDANVAFDWDDGEVTPKLTGRLVATNAGGNRVRVRIDSYTKDGVYLNTEYGNDMDVPSDAEASWTVDRPGISDPLTDQVVVAVEMETLIEGWQTQDDINLDLQTFGDSFKILSQGVDVGGSGFTGGVPTGFSLASWTIEDGEATAEFSNMRLHLDNALGTCGRVRVRYLTVDGTFLDSAESTEHCPGSNDHRSWAADPDIPPYTSSLLSQVEVIAQTQAGGQWNRAGATTLSIAEDG